MNKRQLFIVRCFKAALPLPASPRHNANVRFRFRRFQSERTVLHPIRSLEEAGGLRHGPTSSGLPSILGPFFPVRSHRNVADYLQAALKRSPS